MICNFKHLHSKSIRVGKLNPTLCSVDDYDQPKERQRVLRYQMNSPRWTPSQIVIAYVNVINNLNQ